jgi:membrane-associated phospholipid phosphatase
VLHVVCFTVAVRAAWYRGLIGVAGLVASGIPVRHDRVGPREARWFRIVNDVPDAAHLAVWPVMQLGSLAAVPVTSGVALLAGRRDLAVRLAVAGGTAWAAAKVVKRVRVRGRPARLLGDVHVRGTEVTGGGFVSGHAAVAAALAAAATACVGSPLRDTLWLAVPVVSASRVYVGAHLPLDTLGGASLGITVEVVTSAVLARVVTRCRGALAGA